MKPGTGSVYKYLEKKTEQPPKVEEPRDQPSARSSARNQPKVESPKREHSPPNSKKIGSKKYDDFMKFMENIEDEMSSQYERSAQRQPKKDDPIQEIEESLEISSSAIRAQSKVEPREAYTKVRERMLELEIERDEQQKALELLKEVRERERAELTRAIRDAREEGGEYAEQIKQEMAGRIEKQVEMIEALLEDKR